MQRAVEKYEPLDNGILSCEDPQALQKICEGLNEVKIEKLLRKWLKRLPHPFPVSSCANCPVINPKRQRGKQVTPALPREVFASLALRVSISKTTNTGSVRHVADAASIGGRFSTVDRLIENIVVGDTVVFPQTKATDKGIFVGTCFHAIWQVV